MILDRIDAGATPLSAWPYSWEYGGERGIPAAKRRAVLQAVFDRSQSSSAYFCARLFALLDHTHLTTPSACSGCGRDRGCLLPSSASRRSSAACPGVLMETADLWITSSRKASSAGPIALKRMRSAMLISATPKSTSGKIGEPDRSWSLHASKPELSLHATISAAKRDRSTRTLRTRRKSGCSTECRHRQRDA